MTASDRALLIQEIQDVLFRYARGVDRCDWPLVRSTYHEDAHDDHGQYKGRLDGLMSYLAARHRFIDQSQHFITNIQVELVGDDVAIVESYYMVFQRMLKTAGEYVAPFAPDPSAFPGDRVQIEVYGRYIDRFSRRVGEWRVENRLVIAETVRSSAVQSPSQAWRRDGNDPLDLLRRSAGLPQQA